MYGRVTYQMMENYWPTAGDKPTATKHDIEHAKWYSNVHKVVLSRTMADTVLPGTTIISENLAEGLHEIKKREGKEILLFGSPTATHALIEHDLIDGYWLFVNPIILGKGIPLFTDINKQIQLKLEPATRQFACGVTELNYTVDRP
jgi:dihydrofolate reductase